GDERGLGELGDEINEDVNLGKNVCDGERMLRYCGEENWSDSELVSMSKRGLELFRQLVLM
uniref:hypothetical protein n=1 Tax=Staphylococcus pettenkoferi TaxID=170573 RepID=UPI0011A03211